MSIAMLSHAAWIMERVARCDAAGRELQHSRMRLVEVLKR